MGSDINTSSEEEDKDVTIDIGLSLPRKFHATPVHTLES